MVSEFFAEITPTTSPILHMLQALYLPLLLLSVLHTYGLFIHSVLTDDRSKASSKTIPPHTAI